MNSNAANADFVPVDKKNYSKSVRFDVATASEQPKGNLYISKAGMVDLSGVQIVGMFVDTVRQLYHGVPKSGFLESLEQCVEDQTLYRFKEKHYQVAYLLPFYAEKWHVSKMGKASGYRYKLQNNDVGLILLIGSYYGKLDTPRTHLKIECSPHFLMQYNAEKAQDLMDALADQILARSQPAGCGIHLACDLQGWQPDAQFLSHFVTYSRFIRTFDGIEGFELGDDWAEYALRYGNGKSETVMFGKPTSLQCCIYDKSNQMRRIDKVDYYEAEWQAYSLGNYDPNKPVIRVEMRFHHQVIREVNAGEHQQIQSYKELSLILGNLWEYALSRNRYELQPGILHPVWQMMMEDAQFPDENCQLGLRIVRKKKTDVSAIAKNYDLIIGNLITVYARQGADIKHFMSQLEKMSWYTDFMEHLRRNRKSTVPEFRQKVEKALYARRLVGVAA